MHHCPSKLFRVLSLSALFCLPFVSSSKALAAPRETNDVFASLVVPSTHGLSTIIEDIQDRKGDKLSTSRLSPKIKPTSTKHEASQHTLRQSSQGIALDPGAFLPFYGQLSSHEQSGDMAQLQALSGLSFWHLRALANLKKRLHSRKLELLDYRFSDVNDDDDVELITQSKGQTGQKETWIVGVYSISADSSVKLRYEYAQNTTTDKQTNGQRHYMQAIQGLTRGFSLCEAWQADTWIIHECNDIVLGDTWQAYVLKQRIENREQSSLTSQMTVFDFANRKAERSYTRIPTGPFMPSIKRQNAFAMIYAFFDDSQQKTKTDHAQQLVTAIPTKNLADFTLRAQYIVHNHAANGTIPPPITVQAQYNDLQLKLKIWVQDESIVTLPQCGDDAAIQQADHVALWFDLNPDPSIQNNTESWMLEFQKAYRINPFRHELDEGIVGIAVTSNNCVVPLTQHPKRHAQPQIVAEATPNGYRVDVVIPAAFLGVDRLSELDRPQGINFSAIQHDTNAERDRFFTQATSQWQWPDPFSFGQIWLLPQKPSLLPKYPLDMKTWLSND